MKTPTLIGSVFAYDRPNRPYRQFKVIETARRKAGKVAICRDMELSTKKYTGIQREILTKNLTSRNHFFYT